MIIEGKNTIIESLRSGYGIREILISDAKSNAEICRLAEKSAVKLSVVDNDKLAAIAKSKRHGGVIAYANDYNYCSVEDILSLAKSKSQHPFILIASGIEDPNNLGSILRTAHCLGVHGIIIPKHQAVEANATVARVSSGALFYTLVAQTNVNQAIEFLKKQGVFVYCVDMDGTPCDKANLTGSIALVVGGEDSGVNNLTKKLADGIISINMKGKINSLNASNAAAIAMYEVVRQNSNG